MANGIVTIWRDLPDPRVHTGNANGTASVNIEVPANIWNKIRDKHMQNLLQPWEEWLTTAVLEGVLRFEAASIRQATATIGSGVQASLVRPRYLRAQAVNWKRIPRKPWPDWLIVLRSGAMADIKLPTGNLGCLLSCYFPKPTCNVDPTDPEMRWQETCRWLVFKHTNPATFRKLPHPGEVIQGSEKVESNTDILFVTPKSWGFDGTGPGAQWSPPSEDWDGNPLPLKIPPEWFPRRCLGAK